MDVAAAGSELPALDALKQGQLSEQVREELRTYARRHTYFLAKAVLGFPDLTLKTHLPMCQFIEGPGRRKLALVPRGHLKTHLWTIADTIRRICANPNIRILIANETATNASHMLFLIQQVFKNNALFRWLFPELIPDFKTVTRWNQTELLVPRDRDYPEATVEVIGVGGTVVSRHYNLIKNDDLEAAEAAGNPEVMKKLIDWYKYQESLLINPQVDEIHSYGTPWAANDLYAWIRANEPGVATFVRSADPIDNADGLPFWPERFPVEELERLKLKEGTWIYNTQRRCQPIDPEATSFRQEWLRFYRLDGEMVRPALGPPLPIASLRRTIRVDPAISESDRAARTAIVVDGVAPDGRKFLLDVWAKRCQPSEMFSTLFTLHDRWEPDLVAVEAVAYQKAIKFFLADECVRRDRWINIVEVKPDTKKTKEARIRALQPYFERGEIWVREDQGLFLDEYKSFPVGATVDVLDALAYGPYVWDLPMAEEDETPELEAWQFQTAHDGRSAVTGY